MPYTVRTFITGVACLALFAAAAAPADTPERPRREDSFLGIHFDFHAGRDCDTIGAEVTREVVESIIDQVHPDFIQVDCKGHGGLSSYPTKAGNPAPGIVADAMRVWRDVTAERGVALYVHYSGVWDNEAIAKHPEWARIDADGNIDKQKTSVYGPYVDELLIPQLVELADVYDIDGAWVDGEAWATERDWGDRALRLFTEETGITDIPRSKDDPHWFEFSEFHREGFRRYLRHYVDAIHHHDPDFQVTSNWAFSSMIPEPVSADIDFISGDFSARNSINVGRFEGRCMVNQGKPWDLMSWSFTWTDGVYSTKTVPQLSREAAVVISLGGGYQAYFNKRRDGKPRMWSMPLMAGVADFCRARQDVCHKARPVPQVGLIYSQSAFYRANEALFSAWSGSLTPIKGILMNLLECQNSVEIVMEHHLRGRMDEYPLLVWPEWSYIDPSFHEELLAYVRNGGNLLVIGPRAAALFEDELRVTLEGEPVKRVNALAYNGWIAAVNSEYCVVRPGDGAAPVGEIYGWDMKGNNDIEGRSEIAATVASYGGGRIAAAYLDLGERYMNAKTTVARDFLQGLVRELFPDPMVEVTGSHDVDVVLNRKDGRLMVNLVNTAGPHSDGTILVYDSIPPVGPLTVRVRTADRPSRVSLEPAGREMAYGYDGESITVTVPRLDIHDIIVVEP